MKRFSILLLILCSWLSSAQTIISGVSASGVKINGYEAEYELLLSYATSLGYTLPSPEQRNKQNRLCKCLKDAGAWSQTDIFYLPANDGSSNFGTLNWITPASYQITLFNSPTWTSNEGWDWNGTTQYASTGWAPGTHGVNYTQNDASIWVWINEAVNANSVADFGASNNADGTTNGIFMNSRTATGSNYNVRINANGNVTGSTAATSLGLNGGQRRSSTDMRSWKDGTQVSSSITSSAGLTTSNLFLGATNGNGTATLYATREISAFLVGASMSGLESSIYTCINNYMSNP